jgi:hypothetical protein
VNCPKTNKVQHKSLDAARAHAKSISRAGKGLAFPYPCPFCGQWHVTKRKQKRPETEGLVSLAAAFRRAEAKRPDSPKTYAAASRPRQAPETLGERLL